ncbi:MAG: AAA family ATPase, partial [bacterium]|nr:AAA family ATPase [bacterium]
DVTSGYNIGLNVTVDPKLNGMLGFTRKEVLLMIDYYRSKGKIPHSNEFLLEIMTQWYGNYRFSRKDEERIYNSDMILYFLVDYIASGELPEDLIDTNVRIDYSKLRYLIIIDQGKQKSSNGNFNRLKQIIQDSQTTAKLQKSFPLEKIADGNNFTSLLFYFGLLTVASSKLDRTVLTIPNETIRRLYYDYIKEGYEETNVFSLNFVTYGDLMEEMATRGKWEPFFKYITDLMKESMSLRDLIAGEKTIQAFLNIYLGLSALYIIHPEKELKMGYADIVMEPFLARFEEISYSYLIEIKYTKSGAKSSDDAVTKLKTDAEKQLKNYSMDEKFKKSIGKTTLIKLVLVFSGHQLVHMDAV